jgi:probable rRNA maturation factor
VDISYLADKNSAEKNPADKILTSVCKVLNIAPETVYYNFSFVPQDKIQQLNKSFRGVDKATDILSFPDGDIDPETNKKFLGDIIICKEIAKKQAKEFGQSLEQEITFLKIHGLLHLFGFDHENEEDEKTMREKQREVLQELNGENKGGKL